MLFNGLFKSAQAQTPGPTDNFWYEAVDSATGDSVGSNGAMKISTVYACISIISEDMGKFPIILWEWIDNHVKEEAVKHPLYNMLQFKPNPLQTWQQFAELMTSDALLRSAGFAEIVPGSNGFVTELWRIHPDSLKIERLSNRRVRYKVKEQTAEGVKERYLTQEQVFVLPGKFFDGYTLESAPIKLMADTLVTAREKKTFEKSLFKNAARLSGVLQTDSVLGDEEFKRIKGSWQDAHSGSANAGKVAILEKGLKFQPVSMTSEDAQFIESSKLSARDIALFFRVPAHKVGVMDNANYSNIENENRAYFTDTVMSWSTRWQNAINSNLILEPQIYFAQYDFSMLLRGDSAARSTLYTALTNAGAVTPDEIREKEDMNPLPDDQGSKPVRPLNMTQGGPGGTNQNNGGPAGDNRNDKQPQDNSQNTNNDNQQQEQPADNSQATKQRDIIAASIWRDLFMDAALRVASAEARGIANAPKKIKDPADWLNAFYESHISYVIKTFSILENSYKTAKGCDVDFAGKIKSLYASDNINLASVISEQERAEEIVNCLLGDVNHEI